MSLRSPLEPEIQSEAFDKFVRRVKEDDVSRLTGNSADTDKGTSDNNNTRAGPQKPSPKV